MDSEALRLTEAKLAVMVTVVGDVTVGAEITKVPVVCPAGIVTNETV